MNYESQNVFKKRELISKCRIGFIHFLRRENKIFFISVFRFVSLFLNQYFLNSSTNCFTKMAWNYWDWNESFDKLFNYCFLINFEPTDKNHLR